MVSVANKEPPFKEDSCIAASYRGANNLASCLPKSSKDKYKNHQEPPVIEKELSVPDGETSLKILGKSLACPRCHCEDTKFCYYIYHNINRPRYFCKNCQRYWTAGGATRDVPMGSGKRKSKNSPHMITIPRHLLMLVSQILPPCDNKRMKLVTEDTPRGSVHAKVLHIELEKQHAVAEWSSIASSGNGLDPSCASSATVPESFENDSSEFIANAEKNAAGGRCSGLKATSQPEKNSPGLSWAFPWTPRWNNVNMMQVGSTFTYDMGQMDRSALCSFARVQSSVMPTAVFAVPTIQLPSFPASVWGCKPIWPDGLPNNFKWSAVQGCPPPPSTCNGDDTGYQSCNLVMGETRRGI